MHDSFDSNRRGQGESPQTGTFWDLCDDTLNDSGAGIIELESNSSFEFNALTAAEETDIDELLTEGGVDMQSGNVPAPVVLTAK